MEPDQMKRLLWAFMGINGITDEDMAAVGYVRLDGQWDKWDEAWAEKNGYVKLDGAIEFETDRYWTITADNQVSFAVDDPPWGVGCKLWLGPRVRVIVCAALDKGDTE